MQSYLKNEDGFTLLEAILSIAVLSIISGFILQMFIVSNNANQIAMNMDGSRLVAVQAVESFKALQDPEDIYTVDLFENAFCLESQSDLTYIVGLDQNWEAVGEITGINQLADLDSNYTATDFAFVLVANRTRENEIEEYDIGELTGLHVSIYQWKKDENNNGYIDFAKPLVELAASKYFPYIVGDGLI